jgi:hypothetical protein
VFLGTIEGKVVLRVLILQSIYIRTEKFYTYKFHVKKEIKPKTRKEHRCGVVEPVLQSFVYIITNNLARGRKLIKNYPKPKGAFSKKL